MENLNGLNRSEIKLFVDGQWFTERKQRWSRSSEPGELQDETLHHTQKIGDDKFITIVQKVDKHGHQLTDGYKKWTSKDLDIDSFMTEWKSGWKPANPLDFSLI